MVSPLGPVWRENIIPSTNTWAMERLRQGQAAPFVIVAEQQTAGRGRRGNTWQSPKGNLLISVALQNPAPPARLAEMCFLMVLAADEALCHLYPALANRLQFKWPNDLMLDQAKLAGMLMETETMGTTTNVVLGMGMNVSEAPKLPDRETIALADVVSGITARDVETAWLHALSARLETWSKKGATDWHQDWLAKAAGLQQPVQMVVGTQTRTGIFNGIDQNGALLLQTEQGLQTWHAGEVSLVRPQEKGRE